MKSAMQHMKTQRRLLAASIDGIVLWVVLPFCLLVSEMQFPGRTPWAPAADTLLLGAVIYLEAAGRASFGMSLTRSRLVGADTSDAGLLILLLRGVLKYLPVLLLIPMSAADSLGFSFGEGYVMAFVSYSIALLIGTYCTIMMTREGIIDLLLGLSVRSIGSHYDEKGQTRGFHVVGFDYARPAEPTEKEIQSDWLRERLETGSHPVDTDIPHIPDARVHGGQNEELPDRRDRGSI